MERSLKILILEDSPDDVLLIERELNRAGIIFTTRVVKTQVEFENEIETFDPDVILSDHSLPTFNSIDALKIVSAHNEKNHSFLPFILVTGTVSEEFAAHTIKAGASDFILKDRLKRLPSAILNALQRGASEIDKARYLKQVIASEELMRRAEQLAHFGSWYGDLLTGIYKWSDETYRIFGYEPGEITPTYDLFLQHVHPEDLPHVKGNRDNIMRAPAGYDNDFRIIDKAGRLKHIASKIVVRRDESGKAVGLIGVNHDITERKEAELLLWASRQEYKSLFDQNPDAVYSLDLQGNFTKVNKSVTELTGFTEHMLLASSFRPFIEECDVEMVQRHFESSVSGKPQRYQTKIVGNEGKTAILDVTNIPIIVNDEVIGVHGIAKDITEKVRLQRLLDNAYRLALIGGWELDVLRSEVKWSPITKELHEVEPDFVPDLQSAILFYKEGINRETIINAVNAAIELGKPFDVELQIITAKGNLRWIRAIGKARLRAGKCVSVYGSFQDIHEKKDAEERIKEAYQEKIDILESIGDAFFAVDKNWIVTYWNRMSATYLGMPREAILGKNLWHVYADAVSSGFYDQYHKAMGENVPVHFEEYYPPLGLWLQVSAYPSPSGLSVYFRDITDSKNHLTETEEKNARLIEVARALSHDVRGPLARLMGLTQIIKNYPEPEAELPKTIKMLLESAHDLDKIIRKIVRQTEDLGISDTDA